MFVSTLALAHHLLDSEAAITGLTQYQSGIWRSSLFGELLVGFVALFLLGLRRVDRWAVSKPVRSPAKRLSGRSGDEQPV
jgi:hypothetical protein